MIRRLAEQAEKFPELSLAPLDTAGLDDRDAALAHAIHDAAIRRWFTLEHLLNTALRTPFLSLEPAMRAVLLCGAAQLLFLDRIPVHAAINESVEAAKALIRPGAGPMTNAVLRKMAALRKGEAPVRDGLPRDALPLSDGRWLSLAAPALPADEVERLATATSHPRWLIQRWREQLGVDAARSLALHSLAASPTVLNTTHATPPLPTNLEPHTAPGHHVFTGNRAELVTLLRARLDLWVQDPSSSRAIAAAASLKPNLIVDLCAGQGTKTRQLCATFPEASIVATDTDPARFRTLAAEFTGHPRVRVLPMHDLHPRFAGRADLILLDVPCSNSGVLARRAEAKYRCSDAQLQRLAGIQRQIIADAIPLLSASPRGRILYSTCSIDREENRGIVDWATRWHRFRIEHESSLLPAGLPGEPSSAYRDGSYAALLA